MPYSLGDQVDYCVADGRCVFLDGRTGRYVCLPPKCDAAFQSLMRRSPSPTDVRDALSPLLERGLLLETPFDGLNPPPSMPTLTHSLFDGRLCTAPLPAIAEAVMDRLRATRRVHHLGFQGIVRNLRSQRRNLHRPHVSTDRYLTGVAAFRAARKWVASHDQCFPRSVAMLAYFARRDLFPHLVIGVTTKPFSAHAWIQTDDAVLNDLLETVLTYTPILVI